MKNILTVNCFLPLLFFCMCVFCGKSTISWTVLTLAITFLFFSSLEASQSEKLELDFFTRLNTTKQLVLGMWSANKAKCTNKVFLWFL